MRVFDSLPSHSILHRTSRCDGISNRLNRTDVKTGSPTRVWRIARLLVSANRGLSLPLFSRMHFSSKRSRVIRMPKTLDARRASFRYRPAASWRKIKLREKRTENRKSGNAPAPRSFDIRPLDRHPWDTNHPLRPRFSPYRAAPASVTTTNNRTLLRYLAKALPRSRHVQRKIARLHPAVTYSRIVCGKMRFPSHGTRAVERATLTNCERGD